MVNLVDSNDKRIIERCIGKARNIIWMNLIAGEILRALRIGSCVLVVGGLANQFFYLISPSAVFVASAMPMMFAAVSAFIKRPVTINTANIVDRCLATRSLLTTAFELLQSDAKNRQEFAPWIIRQAAQTALLQQHQLKKTALCKPLVKPWPELGLLLVGVFLLLQPEKVITTAVHDSPPIDAGVSKVEVSVAKTNLIEELRKANQADQPEAAAFSNPPTESVTTAQEQSAVRQPAKTPLDNAEVTAESTALGDDFPSKADASAFTETNQNDAPMQRQGAPGIGSNSDNATSTTEYETLLNTKLKHVAIPTLDGEPKSNNDGSVPFTDYHFAESDKVIKLPPTLTTGKSPRLFNNALSFGQQQYLNTYFKQAHSKK